MIYVNADERDKQKRKQVNGAYDYTTQIYINLMCKKGCKFYDEKKGCLKKRIVRVCNKKGLKNRD